VIGEAKRHFLAQELDEMADAARTIRPARPCPGLATAPANTFFRHRPSVPRSIPEREHRP